MGLHLPSFASKVRRCREMFGETTEQLSAATGIDLPSILDLEEAIREPTGDQVLILADHFRCDFKFFISNEEQPPIERTEKLFRAYDKELSSSDRWAIQEFLFLCENEALVLSELERPPPISFRPTARDTLLKRQGGAVAQELRDTLGYSATEVPEVFSDLRRLGIHVFRRRLENRNISGLFLDHPEAGPCVLVNYVEDVYRQRFTAAHEAAHALFDRDAEYVVSFWRGGDLREVRANAFAGSFLIPPELIARCPRVEWTEERLSGLAEQLGVNVKVLLIALERDGRISKQDRRRFEEVTLPSQTKEDPELPASLSPKGRKRREELLERGISDFYAHACFEARTRGIISAARLAEMLLVDSAELRELGDLFGARGL